MNRIHRGGALDLLKTFESKSANTCVTSPPYYGLRDYGGIEVFFPEYTFSILGFPVTIPAWKGQYGLEPNPMMYVGHTVMIFEEVRRVLRDDGTLWLNIGDSYARNGGVSGGSDRELPHMEGKQKRMTKIPSFAGIKPKDLIGIPSMVAFALRDAGWYWRQDIIWYKRNPMPESVTDRCTKAHEYIMLFSKSPKYYFDHKAIQTPAAGSSIERWGQDIESQKGSDRVPGKTNGSMKAVVKKTSNRKNSCATADMASSGSINHDGKSGYFDKDGNLLVRSTANKRSVWDVTTKPFKGAHFATFPPDLIDPCIKAGCPKGGIVLEPFCGSGTTALVAMRNGCFFEACELNPAYIEMADARLRKEFPDYDLVTHLLF